MSIEDNKYRKNKADIDGSWKLIFSLRAGSEESQSRGVLLDMIEMTQTSIAETLEEYNKHTTKVPSTNATSKATTTKATTPKHKEKTARIFGTWGAEVFMIILVLLMGLGAIALGIKYAQLRDKIKEYRLNGGDIANPTYDNPMYGGGQRAPERYVEMGSIPNRSQKYYTAFSIFFRSKLTIFLLR